MGAKKNRLIETVLLSTHNICFGLEIKKYIWYTLLTKVLSYDKSDFLLCFSITERAVEPLKAQLGEVDQAIKDQLDLIGAVKSNIIRNDMKIEKMLRTIAKS